jgi:acyl-CoA thioesterase
VKEASVTPISPELSWLGLKCLQPGRWTFELTSGLSRFDGKLYGGTGIAVAVALMEAETDRRAVWATVQCVASASTGDIFDCEVKVAAAGRRSSQVQVTGRVDGRLVFAAMGSTGVAGNGPVKAQFGEPPAVEPPDDSPHWAPAIAGPMSSRFAAGESQGWLETAEVRQATGASGRAVPSALWLRIRDHSLSRPALGFLADVVPGGVVRAAGRAGAGTSLDNAVRFGADPEGDWMLLDIEPYMISRGYVHGAGRLWSTTSTLLGVASQSASLLLLD